MIKTLIDAYKKKIQLNPFVLTGLLYPFKNNGFGNTVEDRTGTPEQKQYKNPVRISTEKKAVKNTSSSSTPMSYENVFIMVSDNETVIDERLEFNYQNNTLKVVKRSPKTRYGKIIGYEYELKDITKDIVYAA